MDPSASQQPEHSDCHPAEKVCLLLSILLAVGMLILLLFFQYGKDQGIYSVVGRTILEGGAPYKDAWDFKPPGIFFIYAFARVLFGMGQHAVRILEVFNFLILTSAFAIYSRRHFTSFWPGIFAGCLAIINHVQLGFWDTAQPESFGASVLAWAIVFASYRPNNGNKPYLLKKTLSWALSGLLFTAASLLKPPLGGSILISVTVVAIMQARLTTSEKKIKQTLLVVGSFCFGAMLLLIPVFVYFAQKGALGDIYQTFFVFVPGYTGLEFSFQKTPTLLYLAVRYWLFSFSIFTSIGMAVYFFLPRCNIREFEGCAHVIGIILFQIIGITMQAKYFPYHYGAILPFTALLAVWGYSKLWKKVKVKWLLFLIFIVVISWQLQKKNMFSHFILQAKTIVYPNLRDTINDSLYTVNDLNSYANRKTAEWLFQNTPKDSPIYVWGFEPVIYDMANRESSSRYIYNITQRASWKKEKTRKELINDLMNRPPSAIIVVHNDQLPHVSGNQLDSAEELEIFPALLDFITERYAYVKSFEDFDIYKNKNAVVTGAREG